MNDSLCLQPQIISWTQVLLDNFEQLLGYELISRDGNEAEQAKALFQADFVVVSHGTQADPVLNYGNQTALNLWVMDWHGFTQTPSRLTAEPVNRAQRAKMLAQAQTQGYIDDYSGVRVASNGQRFFIQQAIIWNLSDHQTNKSEPKSGQKLGQAATFSQWQLMT